MSDLACPVKRECATCGIPIDSEFFDVSGFAVLPAPGRETSLARFDLEHQYCGILEYFAQFTDEFSRDPTAVLTPGLTWRLLVNNRPLYPYVDMEAILNPWGFTPFPIRLRLPEGARVELLVRRRADSPALAINKVGGRISGRYWFRADPAHASGATGEQLSDQWPTAQRAGARGTGFGAGTGTRAFRAGGRV